jgi:hypothetical protein
MQILSLVWGIISVVGMLLGFIPCLGWWNWINIPFAAVGIIISGIALGTAGDQPKGGSITGLVCSIVALIVGIFRLSIGGGVF